MMSRNHLFVGKLSTQDVKKLRSMMYIYNDWTRESEWADYQILTDAIKRGNMRATNFLLKKGCRVTKPGSNVFPLHLAVGKLGWYSIVEKLLAVGARVTDRDDKANTALHVAFLNYGSDKVLDLLLERYLLETDENICNKDGISFLHIACTRPKVEIIRDFVLREQADVNSQVSGFRSIFSGCTPLHFAAEYSQPDIISFLLHHNAELYARDLSGSTALHYALERRDVMIIDLILSYDYRFENIVNSFGLSHFMAACVGTNKAIVHNFLRVVLSHPSKSVSALIDETCRNNEFAGYSSKLFAAEFRRYETLELLNNAPEENLQVNSSRKSKGAELSGKSCGFSDKYFAFWIVCTLCLLTVVIIVTHFNMQVIAFYLSKKH